MSKITFTGFMFLLVLLFASPDANSNNSAPRKQTIPESRGQSGTLQKMIVESGTVTMDLDMDRLNADGSLAAKVVQLRFDVAANSFFSILVFNDLLRGPEQGSMALVPQAGVNAPGYSNLPIALARSLKQLVIENFLPTRRSILPCVTARRDSPFLILKETSTINRQRSACLQFLRISGWRSNFDVGEIVIVWQALRLPN